MTTTTPASAAPRSSRPLALAIIDIAAGIIVILFGLLLGLIMLATAGQIRLIEGGDVGLRETVTSILTAVIIFGWAIPSGMFVVRAIQRRYAFYWPIIGIIIIVVAFYAGSAVIGNTVPA